MVSFRFCPSRLLSLREVVTLTCANAAKLSARHRSTRARDFIRLPKSEIRTGRPDLQPAVASANYSISVQGLSRERAGIMPSMYPSGLEARLPVRLTTTPAILGWQ